MLARKVLLHCIILAAQKHSVSPERKSWHVKCRTNSPPLCYTDTTYASTARRGTILETPKGTQPVGHKGETPCSNVSGCTPLDGTAATPETGIDVYGAKRAELAQNSCTLRLPHPARRGFILATLYHISACTQEFAYFVIATA